MAEKKGKVLCRTFTMSNFSNVQMSGCFAVNKREAIDRVEIRVLKIPLEDHTSSCDELFRKIGDVIVNIKDLCNLMIEM